MTYVCGEHTEAIKRSNLKTLIIDFDGHHGNGTQDIFSESKDIFYISLHKSPCYPGTGLDSKNNILNYPLDENTTPELYIEILEKAINKTLKKFKPHQIAVSAGFDAYKKDPLASLNLEKDTFYKIGKIINKTAKKTNSRVFSVLEGGYSKELGELILEFIKGIEDK